LLAATLYQGNPDKMGWTYNSGPGCNESIIGEFVNGSFIGDKDWKCVNGCEQPIVKVGPAYYYCTAARIFRPNV
jgi:hypothetical protein